MVNKSYDDGYAAVYMYPNIKVRNDLEAARLLHEGLMNHMGLDVAKKFLMHDPPLMGNIPDKFRSGPWLDKNYPDCGDCIACLKGKARQMDKPRKKTEREPLIRIGQLVVSDLITLDDDMESSYMGHRYIIFFFCIVSGYCIHLTLASRENIAESFAWAIDVFRSYGHKIETLQSDNEYVTEAISALRGQFGFTQRLSCPIEAKFQNGYAEKMVQTVKNQERCALFTADVTYPKWAWTQALQFAINMRNITTLTLAGTETAYTAFTGIKLVLSDLTTIPFGTRCEVLLKDSSSGALDERTVKGFYLGPVLNSKNVSQFMILDDNGTPGRVTSSTEIGRRSWWPVSEQATEPREPENLRPVVMIDGPIDNLESIKDDFMNPTPSAMAQRIISPPRGVELAPSIPVEVVTSTQPTPIGQPSNALPRGVAAGANSQVAPRIIVPIIVDNKGKVPSAREFISSHKSRKTVEKERRKEATRQKAGLILAMMDQNRKEKAAVKTLKANEKNARDELAKKALKDEKMLKEAKRTAAEAAAKKAKEDAILNKEAKSIAAAAADAKAKEDARLKREAEKAAQERERAEKALEKKAETAKKNYDKEMAKVPAKTALGKNATAPQRNSRNFSEWCKPESKRSKRMTKSQAKEDQGFMASVAVAYAAMTVSFASLPDPRGNKAAMKAPDADMWREAENREMDRIFFGRNSGTEVTHEQMKGKRPLHSMFNYRKKFDPSTGEYLQHKARMLIMGNEEEVDPDENNYAPTVSLDSVRLIFKAVQAERLLMDTADIEAAFLQEYMPEGREDVYIELPLSWTNGKRRYFRLNKSHYGLRGAPKIFHDGLVEHLISLGYIQCPHDPCVFKRVAEDGEYILLAIHVDDILVASSSVGIRDQFKTDLGTKYGYTYQSEATKYIGISIIRDKENNTLKINQPVYARHIVTTTGQSESTLAESPANHLPFTGKSAGPGDQDSLRVTTGLVQFLYSGTRPDVGVALNKVAAKQGAPTVEDNIAARRIVRNIAATADDGITYSGTDMTLYSHADASFGQEKEFKSRNGFCHNLGRNDGLIAWHTSVQTMTAQSTQEAEVITLSECARQTVHLRAMLNWMGFPQEGPTTILEDNQGAIAFAEGRGSHDRNRHIGVRYYYVKEQVARGVVRVEYVDTTLQLADIFTKILLPENHRTQASKVLGAG